MKVSLDNNSIISVLSPQSDNYVTQALFQRQYQKLLLSLKGLLSKLSADAPALVAETQFAEAISLLETLPSQFQRQVLDYPSVYFWTDVTIDLVRRRAHVLFPEMHIRTHLIDFWRFVVAAFYVAESGSVKCTVLTDSRGNVVLPGSSRYLTSVELRGFRQVTIELKSDISVYFKAARLPFMTKRIPLIADTAIEFNHVDLDFRLAGRTDFEFEQVDRTQELKWIEALSEAVEQVGQVSPALLKEMLTYIKCVVPVLSNNREVHKSASFQEAPGLIALSYTPDVFVMAEALVHEYHHQKLNALMVIDPLITGPTLESVFYSPWRSDARPLSGVLHGAYVFQAVIDYWLRALAQKGSGLVKRRILERLHVLKVQVLSALTVLENQGEFSELGNILVKAMHANMNRMVQEIPPIEPDRIRHIQESIDDHRARWESSNSLVNRESRPAPNAIAATDLELTVLRILGIQQHQKFNFESEYRTPTDPLLNGVVALYSTSGLEELSTTLESGNAFESDLLTLVYGHVSYLMKKYDAAAYAYSRLLSKDHGLRYYWLCFAFALRNMGSMADSTAIIENIDLLSSARTFNIQISDEHTIQEYLQYWTNTVHILIRQNANANP